MAGGSRGTEGENKNRAVEVEGEQRSQMQQMKGRNLEVETGFCKNERGSQRARSECYRILGRITTGVLPQTSHLSIRMRRLRQTRVAQPLSLRLLFLTQGLRVLTQVMQALQLRLRRDPL